MVKMMMMATMKSSRQVTKCAVESYRSTPVQSLHHWQAGDRHAELSATTTTTTTTTTKSKNNNNNRFQLTFASLASDRPVELFSTIGMWRSPPISASKQISCAKSVRCKHGFVARSKLPAITATAIQLRYLKLNSCKWTSSEQLK